MEFFFCDKIDSPFLHFNEVETVKHFHALRLQKGHLIHVTNGQGKLVTAKIHQITKKEVSCEVLKLDEFTPPTRNIILCIPPLKNSTRLEWLIEKATELNVTAIQPIITQRTVGYFKKRERLEKIIEVASLQSQRIFFPQLHDPLPFPVAVKAFAQCFNLIAYCQEPPVRHPLQHITFSSNQIVAWIGPEGDFTPEEVTLAINNGFIPVNLGERRLRTETAAIAMLSYISLHH